MTDSNCGGIIFILCWVRAVLLNSDVTLLGLACHVKSAAEDQLCLRAHVSFFLLNHIVY